MLLISFSVILSPLSLPRRVRRRWEFSSVCITPRMAESLRPHRGLKLSNKRGGEREKKRQQGIQHGFWTALLERTEADGVSQSTHSTMRIEGILYKSLK